MIQNLFAASSAPIIAIKKERIASPMEPIPYLQRSQNPGPLLKNHAHNNFDKDKNIVLQCQNEKDSTYVLFPH